ncbi:hypothetical protein [Tumebacillus avium]|uniref:hypothetical protein n=1 Tax=Tumebacillus avium TaxID=1903704 RepID=UPI0012FE2D61|nr:hypothetical protein [Tumebacillus avium]
MAVFMLLSLLVYLLFQRSHHNLQTEIAMLPDEIVKGGFQHGVLGVNLHVVLPLPEHVRQRPAIIMLASPSCSACEQELHDWIRANAQEPVPFMCFYEQEEVEVEKLRDFLEAFEGHVPMQPYPAGLNNRIGVDSTPFVMLIDSNGIVHRVQRPLRLLVKYYRKMKERI